MNRLALLICIVALGCLLSGCDGKRGEHAPTACSASDGPFELIVECKPAGDGANSVLSKLTYTEDRNARIHHGKPLISVLVAPVGNDVMHMFDNIGLSTDLQPGETVTDGGPKTFPAERGDAVVSVQAHFEWEGKFYFIPVEFEY